MGPMSGREKTLAILFLLAVLGWALGSVFKIDATAVAVGFVAACLLTGVVGWDNILGYKSAWSTFMWYGGIIGLADALSRAKFFEWLAKVIGANVNFAGINPIAILAALVLFSLVVRYLFASMAAYVATMIPVLFTLALVAKVPLLPLIFLIAFSAGYGGMLTHYGGRPDPGPLWNRLRRSGDLVEERGHHRPDQFRDHLCRRVIVLESDRNVVNVVTGKELRRNES